MSVFLFSCAPPSFVNSIYKQIRAQAIWLGWLVSKLEGSACLYLCTRTADVCYLPHQFFMGVLEI